MAGLLPLAGRPAQLLDVGCGLGHLLDFLAERGAPSADYDAFGDSGPLSRKVLAFFPTKRSKDGPKNSNRIAGSVASSLQE